MWGAFPVVYAMLLSAFYMPLLLMLAGLILRGVAFEFRDKAERSRWVWDVSFAGGSFVAAFMQGVMVGALVEGLPIANGQYTGGEFGWLSPSPCCAASGSASAMRCSAPAGWSEDAKVNPFGCRSARSRRWRSASWSSWSSSSSMRLPNIFQVLRRWTDRPYLFVFPVIGAVAAAMLAHEHPAP